MIDFNFDFRDVFRAARLGLSSKKMWVMLISLLSIHVIYFVFGYMALLLCDFSLAEIWHSFGLFPLAVVDQFSWLSWMAYLLGIVTCLIVYLFASTVVGRITYRQLRDDDFCTVGEAIRFTARHWKAALVSPFSYVLIVAFFAFCGLILGLVARIPWIGELGFSVFLVPVVFVAAFVALIGVATVLSFALGPAIVASTGEDTMETCIQSFSTLWSQPWRVVAYEALLKIMTAIATGIFGFFVFAALLLVYWICGIFMGPKLANIASVAIHYLPTCPFFQGIPRCLSIFQADSWLPVLPVTQTMGTTGQIAAVICGLSLVVIMWVPVSYAWSTLAAGQTIIYAILRKKKDDDNLLERTEEELGDASCEESASPDPENGDQGIPPGEGPPEQAGAE